MEPYEHITKQETAMNQFQDVLEKLETLLSFLDEHRQDYKDLIGYYYSDQRDRDLCDDEQGRIPQDLPRGVLSEDGIFDFLGDYRDTALHMMETALHMIKED